VSFNSLLCYCVSHCVGPVLVTVSCFTSSCRCFVRMCLGRCHRHHLC